MDQLESLARFFVICVSIRACPPTRSLRCELSETGTNILDRDHQLSFSDRAFYKAEVFVLHHHFSVESIDENCAQPTNIGCCRSSKKSIFQECSTDPLILLILVNCPPGKNHHRDRESAWHSFAYRRGTIVQTDISIDQRVITNHHLIAMSDVCLR